MFTSHELGKCLTGPQNVRQSAEGLLDKMCGTPKIIFAFTGTNPPNYSLINEL